MQLIRQIETSEVEEPEGSPPQNQRDLDDSNLKDISEMGSDEKTEISAPKGHVTRSMAAGGGKVISNYVQVVTEMLHPLGELISKPGGGGTPWLQIQNDQNEVKQAMRVHASDMPHPFVTVLSCMQHYA